MTDSALLQAETLVVQQKAKLFELRNQYQILDATGQPLGAVEQVNQSALTVLARIFSQLDVALPMHLEVRDATGLAVLHVQKPWFRMRVAVLDSAGTVLGTIRKQIRLGKARFLLADPADNVIGEVQAQNWRARDFVVNDANGLEVARVAKQWAGVAKELFTDADNYVIHLSPALTGPLRGLAIGSAWAIDIIMKQKDTN